MKVELMQTEDTIYDAEKPPLKLSSVKEEDNESGDGDLDHEEMQSPTNGSVNGDDEEENNERVTGKRKSENRQHEPESKKIKKKVGAKSESEKIVNHQSKVPEIEYKRVNMGPDPIPSEIEYSFTNVAEFLDIPDLFNFSRCSKKTFLACSKSKIWNLVALRCAETLSGHMGAITILARLKSWVFSGSYDGKIKLWELETWEPMRTILMAQPAQQQQQVVRHDGQRQGGEQIHGVTSLEVLGDILYTGLDDGHVMMNPLVRKSPQAISRKQMGHQGKVKCLRVTEEKLFSGGSDGKISVYEAKTLRPLQQLRGHRKGLISLEVSNNRLFSSAEDGNIFVWNLETLNCETILSEEPTNSRAEMRMNITHEERISCTCSFDNKLVSCAWDCSMKMWDTQTLSCLASIFLNPLSICWAIALRTTDNLPPHLICSVRDGEIEMRSIEDLYLMPGTASSSWSISEDGHTSWINTVLPLPDGRIITGSDDWNLKVWHVVEAQHERKYIEMKKAKINSAKKSSKASVNIKRSHSEIENRADESIKEEPTEPSTKPSLKIDEKRTGI